MVCLGLKPRGGRMVCTDKSTELWHQKKFIAKIVLSEMRKIEQTYSNE